MEKDILLTADNDLMIANGDFVIGECEMQEVAIIVELDQGNLKRDPVLGPNLVTNIRGTQREERIKRALKTNLAMDNKDFESIKNKLILR
jgi:hypothetical protein